MSNRLIIDPYFDDEDEENEEAYRDILRRKAPVPPCDPKTLPTASLSPLCTLCSREEAERILKQAPYKQPGNFILRPSIYPNHPYSLSVVVPGGGVFHFQIAVLSNQYVLGPLANVNKTTSKFFPTITAFIEHFLSSPLQFQDNEDLEWTVQLKLYYELETTQF